MLDCDDTIRIARALAGGRTLGDILGDPANRRRPHDDCDGDGFRLDTASDESADPGRTSIVGSGTDGDGDCDGPTACPDARCGECDACEFDARSGLAGQGGLWDRQW